MLSISVGLCCFNRIGYYPLWEATGVIATFFLRKVCILHAIVGTELLNRDGKVMAHSINLRSSSL